MKYLFFFLAICLAPQFGSAQTASPKVTAQIMEVLDRQRAAWNGGDLEGFMADYWKSPELQFVGSSGLTTGWQATLDRYRKSYPDKGVMGQLTFDILDVSQRSKKVVTVVGKWTLQRAADAPTGHFLIVLRKQKGRWVIVADHSS